MNIIETHALSRVYGKRRAVDSLDMRVAAGEIYGFVGKNGAGKSTAMKMIAGLVRPTSGSVELFGAQRRAREGFSRVGALIEDPGILPTFSALENLMCKALALGVVRPNAHCRELLELVGLADTGSLRVKKFSLGMKQRLDSRSRSWADRTCSCSTSHSTGWTPNRRGPCAAPLYVSTGNGA